MLPNLGAVNVLIHGLLGRRRRRLHPLRPAGQGPRRVGPLPHRAHPGGPAVSRVGADGPRRTRRVGADGPPRTTATALRATATEFVRREVAPYLQEWEDAGTHPARAAPGGRAAGAARARLRRGRRRRGRRPARHDRAAGGDVRGRRLQRADGRAVHRTASRCRTSRPTARPTWSTGSCARRWPARRSARSRSPSRAAARTSRASAPRPGGRRRRRTTSSTAPRRSSPAACAPTSSPPPSAPGGAGRTPASRLLVVEKGTPGLHRRPRPRPRWAGTAPTPPSCRFVDVRVPVGEPGRRGERRVPPDRRAVRRRADRRSRCTPTASPPARWR